MPPSIPRRRTSPESVLRLWHRYKKTGDPRVRDRLVFALAPLVRYIVYRKIREIPAHRDVEDFLSSGLEALIGSIERYDPAKGAMLEQFAWMRIHGAMIDELRRYDWAPRSLRRSERELHSARERFVALHGRVPTRLELSAALGRSERELAALLADLGRSEVTSLNTLVLTDEDPPTERIDTVLSADRDLDPEYAAVRRHALTRFRAAFQELPARERRVAVLLHVNNLTLRQTGELLGVSESRICQIHGQLRQGLRRRLEDEEELFLEVA